MCPVAVSVYIHNRSLTHRHIARLQRYVCEISFTDRQTFKMHVLLVVSGECLATQRCESKPLLFADMMCLNSAAKCEAMVVRYSRHDYRLLNTNVVNVRRRQGLPISPQKPTLFTRLSGSSTLPLTTPRCQPCSEFRQGNSLLSDAPESKIYP